MDTKLLDIIHHSIKPLGFIERLPISSHIKVNDLISTELFWVLYDTSLHIKTQEAIIDFLIQNIITHNISKIKLEQTLDNNLKRHSISNKILSNPWLITEYFVVDNLKRNMLWKKQENQIINKVRILWHSKASPEQDEISKIDFLSHIITGKDRYNVWIQLTTHTQHQYTYSIWLKAWEWHRSSASSKKQKISDYSQNISNNNVANIPSEYQKYVPDMLWYMVINGGIDRILNIEKYNFFAVAFNQWQAEWFPLWWPWRYIRKDLLQLLHNIGHYYQTSLLLCQKFIEHNLLKNNTWFQKKKFDKEDIKYIETYKPQVNELLYEFFIWDFFKWETTLLFSISYFVWDHIKRLLKK